jgi:hypothetical protein
MESSGQVPDEFDTILELLKITYEVFYMKLNRGTTIYLCNL